VKKGSDPFLRQSLSTNDVNVVPTGTSWLAPDHRYFKVPDTQGDELL